MNWNLAMRLRDVRCQSECKFVDLGLLSHSSSEICRNRRPFLVSKSGSGVHAQTMCSVKQYACRYLPSRFFIALLTKRRDHQVRESVLLFCFRQSDDLSAACLVMCDLEYLLLENLQG